MTTSSTNLTGLYGGGPGGAIPNTAYGNANVVGLLAAGTDGGNTVSNIVATGNVSGSYFLGNGSQLTGLPTGYSNAQVANYLASGTNSSNIITSANISGTYILGNGSQLTGLPATYSNANVATFLANFGSNTISTTGNVTGGNINGTSVYSTGNVSSGNVNTTNVYASGVVSATGNVTSGNINTTSVYATGVVSATGNVRGGNINTGGIITATGNVYGDYFIGNGSQLTGLPATYSNAQVAAYLASGAVTSNIITSANITGGYLTTSGSTGNIQGANYIIGNYFIGNGSLLTGITGTYGNANVATLLANFGSNAISTTGNVTAGYFIGNGSLLSSLTGANVTGTVANATYAVNANAATFAGTVTDAAQPNITSVGILSSLSVSGNTTTGNLLTGGIVSATGNIVSSGNISTSGNVIGAYLWGDGSNITGSVQHAAAVRFPVKNTSGGTLTRGTPVYVTGTVGATDTVEVSPSRADTIGTMGAVGLLESDLTVNATGYAVSVGILSGFDTSTYTVGAQLYVGATGGLTQTRPTGANVVQSVGVVGRVNVSTGAVEVNIWNYDDLPNLGNGNIWIGNAAAGYPTQVTLATYTGNIGAGNVNVSELISATGNILTGGQISATGNIQGNVFIGNGAGLTNIPAGNIVGGYGNANVADFLANGFGSNTITTTGNITSGNILTSGVVSATANITGGNILTAGVVSATANITGGNLLTGGLASIAGNVTGANLATYYAPAATSFMGAVISMPTTAGSMANVLGNPWRWVVGNGFNGDYSANIDPLSLSRGSQLAVMASQTVANADPLNTARLFTSTQFVNLNAGNITSTAKRYGAFGTYTQVGNGNITLTIANGTNPAAVLNSAGQALLVGNQGNALLGNAYVSHTTATNSALLAATGGNIGNGAGYVSTLQTQAASSVYVSSMIGYVPQFQGTAGTTAGNVIGFYFPSNVATNYGWNSTNLHRAATNYYAFKNDDAVAQVQLGSLRAYNQYQYATATSGTVNIDKNNAQVQYLAPTGNVTIGDFQNFVTTANDGTNNDNQSDIVTLIVQQGATPYTITMPTGNAAIKYANNVSTVANTASAVTTITIQAFRSSANAAVYLTTISPEFV